MKHDLPVFDASLREFPHAYVPDHKRIASALIRARRFHLDIAASEAVGRVVGAAEDLILKHQQFALPPYPTMCIELNCRVLYEAAGKRKFYRPKKATKYDWEDTHKDEWVSYLIDGDSMWVASRPRSGNPGMAPFRVDMYGKRPSMNFPGGSPPGDKDWLRLAIMLGSGVHHIPDEETRQALLHRFTIHPSFAAPMVYEDVETYYTATGDVRNMLAVLLLLNQPKVVKLIAQPPRAFLRKGKRVVYAAHNTVEIELGKRRDVRKLFARYADRASPRRHEVRGHFAHFHGREGCVHQWPTFPEHGSPPRWTCKVCGCLRVWREHYERGDAGTGFVTKDYALGGEQHE